MVELLQSLFDAIKAPFALFGDLLGYIRYYISYTITAVESVKNLTSSLSGLPVLMLTLMGVALTFGIIRLVTNRRS